MKSWKRRFKVRFPSYIQLISVSEISMSYVMYIQNLTLYSVGEGSQTLTVPSSPAVTMTSSSLPWPRDAQHK